MKSLHEAFQYSPNSIPSFRLFSSLSLPKPLPNSLLEPNENVPPFHPPHPINPHPQSPTVPTKQAKLNNAHFPKPFNLHPNPLTPHQPISARHPLAEIPHPNLNSFNLTISSHNQSSQFHSSFSTFKKITSLGLKPNYFTYRGILSACVASQNLGFGEQVYTLVLKNGFVSDGYVLTGLIDLFAKCGSFGDALRVFEENCDENVVCWNAIIAGGVRNGENLIALELFHRMVKGFCMPNGFTFSSVLSACAAAGKLVVGRGIHGWVVKCDIKDDVFVGTSIVDLYAKCGDMDAAEKEFSRMPVRNVVSWTALISGFVQKNESVLAMNFFKEMIETFVDINKCTLTSVLMACSKSSLVKETKQIHCWTLKNGLFEDIVVKEAFISTYAKIGKFQMAKKVFDDMGLAKSVGSWSAMISGLVQSQSLRRSVEIFKRMLCEHFKPDKKCSSSILSIVGNIDFGRQIHSYVVKVGLVSDVLVASALFTMYSKCGSIEESYELFKQMEEKDRVSWTSMISGFAAYGHADEAFRLFRDMILEEIKPDNVTLAAILAACYDHPFLLKGKEIHGYALRDGLGRDIVVSSSLITMYFKCRSLVSARRAFDAVPRKDQVTWSSLVSGYSTNGYNEAALSEFHHMIISGFEVDHITSSSVIGMCGNLSRPALGRQLHAHGIKAGLKSYLSVSSALVTMYSNCGSIEESRKVFDEIENHDLVTWTAMIDGYAQHGRGLEALKVFELMKKNGIKPDSVTFVGVLSACSHNGLVEEGFVHFNSMRRVYGIEPVAHHYACMVDLLGRSGRLKEAAEFIDKMPIEPDSLIWSTLLGACRVYGDVELGNLAAKKVFELEPGDSGAYISLSNISADKGDWEEVGRIRSSMKRVGMKKEPGWSTV